MNEAMYRWNDKSEQKQEQSTVTKTNQWNNKHRNKNEDENQSNNEDDNNMIECSEYKKECIVNVPTYHHVLYAV